LRPTDNGFVKAGKVVTRVPLGIATLGFSELGIHAVKMDERCGPGQWMMDTCLVPQAASTGGGAGLVIMPQFSPGPLSGSQFNYQAYQEQLQRQMNPTYQTTPAPSVYFPPLAPIYPVQPLAPAPHSCFISGQWVNCY